MTRRRKFSTQQPESQQQQQPQQQATTDDDVPSAEANRLAFKTIVSTMNADQQMVVQALVAESSMLRNEINNFSHAIQAQEEQAQRVMAQLTDIQNHQKAHKDEADDTFQHLDINSPTYLQDMIAVEKNPRVKQAMERELQVKQEIKPLLDIMEVAVQEKADWQKRSSRSTLALFTLAGLVAGQSIMLYTMGTPDAHGAGVSHDPTVQTYLQEAVDIIQHYETQLSSPNKTVGGETGAGPSGKWSIFKEKIRLHNLANPKATIALHQAVE